MPSYLPNVNAGFTAYQVTNPEDPTSLDKTKKIESTTPNMSSTSMSINPNRYVKENPAGIKNGITDFWDGKDNYFSIVKDTPYYGETIYWNGVCKMAPYQIPPTLKTLALTKASAESGDDVFLNKAQGEFDFSTIDFNIISKRELVKTVKQNGIWSDEVAEQIKVARGFGDLSENSEYDEAKNEQGKLYSRIAELEEILQHVVIVDESNAPTNVVTIGCKVTVADKNGNTMPAYRIVGSQESDPMNGIISEESPFGKALVGAKEGDTVTVEAPSGAIVYTVQKIER